MGRLARAGRRIRSGPRENRRTGAPDRQRAETRGLRQIAGRLGAQIRRGDAQCAGRSGASGAGPPHRGPAARLMTMPISLEGEAARPAIGPIRVPHCLLALAGFTLLTAIFFWPWVTQLSTALIGPPEDNLQDFWNSW